ncbi:DUF402 domain-containing protein [Streptomyces sp. ICBB 8177]|uniref:cytidylyl-2-hydroxypropylphosphonate hydrolase n=1 Tax=Streptomyces sp. ICBB 8177 TaxID=563922 RepID=UPI000D67527C|nr:DUF402 domain-containing protein [Streptomyces sp. ICBB 8177]PWI43879.1 hypothetical protein CK485_17605 [Streptomyces sp. ICBB 8177]
MTADAHAPTGPRDVARWEPGTHILWRYRGNGERYRDQVHIARPVTVVRDDAQLLAVWMAPGTRCVKPVLADGTPVHREPLRTRYRKPRTTTVERWWGTGVLKLARPGEPWSVWLFWRPEWRFKNWYVNLEAPHRRWSGGVDSEDHFLDIAVSPDGSWGWLDEDEFTQAQTDGVVGPELAESVREAGARAVSVIEEWGPPFRDDWPAWRPDPSWTVPTLPDDWDRLIPQGP